MIYKQTGTKPFSQVHLLYFILLFDMWSHLIRQNILNNLEFINILGKLISKKSQKIKVWILIIFTKGKNNLK